MMRPGGATLLLIVFIHIPFSTRISLTIMRQRPSISCTISTFLCLSTCNSRPGIFKNKLIKSQKYGCSVTMILKNVTVFINLQRLSMRSLCRVLLCRCLTVSPLKVPPAVAQKVMTLLPGYREHNSLCQRRYRCLNTQHNRI